MLRQLARLARPVPSAGRHALAIAVYGDADGLSVAAQQAGYEGVACVDDAARALQLYCALWEETRLPWVLRWCRGLLDFVLSMQDPGGRWVNFILDWEGTPNRTGRTSSAGGLFWQARALLALAEATRILDDERIGEALQRGLPHVVAATDVPADVRALHIMTALALPGTADHLGLRYLLGTWCDEVVACRHGDMLLNARYERGRPHLWGHVQEAALADAGVRLGRADLIDCARRSAVAVFANAISSGFPLVRTQPYDVSCAVHVMTRLAAVTGSSAFAQQALVARAWFTGRNPAAQPVYDRDAGRIADGIDGTVVSAQSGAEANIEGARAMFDDTVLLAHRLAESEVARG